MIMIQYDFSNQCYDYEQHCLRISPDEHNNFYLDPANGSIKLRRLPTAMNSENTPGNGIDGKPASVIPIVRLNNSVTRKVAGDPTPENEGVVLPDLLDAYFASLGV